MAERIGIISSVSYALVTNNLLDMWRQPKFDSERLNQLHFGSIVEVVGTKAGYCQVVKEDGYRGWADKRLLSSVKGESLREYIKKLNWVVVANTTPIFDRTGRNKTAPYFLYYGTRVSVASKKDGLAKVALPDGTTIKLRISALKKISNSRKTKVTGREVTKEAKKFLGVPYLWGGISPSGFDCSGLVQTIFSRFGYRLPRDCKDQVKCGRKILRSDIAIGDLLFFKRHVAMALSADNFIHCTLSGGGVRISSMLQQKADYREDLDKNFKEARRVL